MAKLKRVKLKTIKFVYFFKEILMYNININCDDCINCNNC